jgi:hypothetical protein
MKVSIKINQEWERVDEESMYGVEHVSNLQEINQEWERVDEESMYGVEHVSNKKKNVSIKEKLNEYFSSRIQTRSSLGQYGEGMH